VIGDWWLVIGISDWVRFVQVNEQDIAHSVKNAHGDTRREDEESLGPDGVYGGQEACGYAAHDERSDHQVVPWPPIHQWPAYRRPQ